MGSARFIWDRWEAALPLGKHMEATSISYGSAVGRAHPTGDCDFGEKRARILGSRGKNSGNSLAQVARRQEGNGEALQDAYSLRPLQLDNR